jgi:FtsH-binding integral membrane protein
MHSFEFWIFFAWVFGIMLITGWPSDQNSWFTSAVSMLFGCIIAICLAAWLGITVIAIIMALVIVCLIAKAYQKIKTCYKPTEQDKPAAKYKNKVSAIGQTPQF